MTLERLIAELGPLPRMMTAAEELKVIRRLSAVPDEQILKDLERFFPLLWDLFDSHTGAAVFEVDDSNLDEFRAFADRLRGLATKLGADQDRERLRNIADAFSDKFSM